MNISILTQPLHVNYGGTLQAFALQHVLRQFGHNPVTINYRKLGESSRSTRFFLSYLKNKVLNRKIRYSFTENDILVISKHHKDFIDKHISYTSPIYDVNELKHIFLSGDFDAVIVGSDQTWRPRYSPRIDSFFLDFLIDNNQIKKIAYASSFGTDDWEFDTKQTKKFSTLLKGFDFISVREDSAVHLCEEKFGVSSEHVLDPTLLVNKEEYLKLAFNANSQGVGKVFNYVLDKSDGKQDIISKVCDILGKKSFSTYPKITIKYSRVINDYSDYIYPSIESWVRSFYDTDFIVTDSFHGTVFSIIFNKPFIAVANESRGKARFTSLLKEFGLENRLVASVDEITSRLIHDAINYDDVNTKLMALRNSSLLKLKNALLV